MLLLKAEFYRTLNWQIVMGGDKPQIKKSYLAKKNDTGNQNTISLVKEENLFSVHWNWPPKMTAS